MPRSPRRRLTNPPPGEPANGPGDIGARMEALRGKVQQAMADADARAERLQAPSRSARRPAVVLSGLAGLAVAAVVSGVAVTASGGHGKLASDGASPAPTSTTSGRAPGRGLPTEPTGGIPAASTASSTPVSPSTTLRPDSPATKSPSGRRTATGPVLMIPPAAPRSPPAPASPLAGAVASTPTTQATPTPPPSPRFGVAKSRPRTVDLLDATLLPGPARPAHAAHRLFATRSHRGDS